jgi:hypothetical protein
MNDTFNNSFCDDNIIGSSIDIMETHICKSGHYNNNNNHEYETHDKDNDHSHLIYRYKFIQEFMDALFQFSKVHQYDDRQSFKEAWEIWIEQNENLVNSEVRRLSNLDYDGDVINKMFKSARYYYRKKGTEKNAPIERRPYVTSQKELIDAMDEHIQKNCCKPSDGFIDFCNSHVELLKKEVDTMVHLGFRDPSEIKNKIKKTYKNRYFLFIKNKK